MSGGPYLLKLSNTWLRKCEIKKGTFRLTCAMVSGWAVGGRSFWTLRSSWTPWRRSLRPRRPGLEDVPDETLFTFSFCCQCLHAVFALFTLKHDHNKALGARGEAALPLSQGQAAVHRHHRLQVQHGGSQVTTELRFCGRMGRQRLYLKKRPLVLLLQMH